MNVFQYYQVFLMELKDLFDKYMIEMNDVMYFMDKNNHYSVTFCGDSFILNCFEKDESETFNIPELKTVKFEEEFEVDDMPFDEFNL